MNPSEADKEQIRQLMALSTESLVSQLAPPSSGALEGMFDSVAAGWQVFEQAKATLHRRLCVEWSFCTKKSQDRFQDPLVLVASVADVVVGSITGVPPFVIATLVVKIGLSGFCHCD